MICFCICSQAKVKDNSSTISDVTVSIFGFNLDFYLSLLIFAFVLLSGADKYLLSFSICIRPCANAAFLSVSVKNYNALYYVARFFELQVIIYNQLDLNGGGGVVL